MFGNGMMIVAQATRGGNEGLLVLLLLVFVAAMAFFLAGIRRVPIGAVGLLISMGRRTGETRSEGVTWIMPLGQQLKIFFLRERQIDIPATAYFTADRSRITFKTTLRVTVVDPFALLNQGPGTYGPFIGEEMESRTGGEEGNTPFHRLAHNSIRESVQSMRMDEVMFGGGIQGALGTRIRDGLSQTSRRWGLDVVEVWLTDVNAEDAQMRVAAEAEVRESLAGRGQLAAFGAQVAKGTMFSRVAAEMVESVRRDTGREISMDEAMGFLTAFYQNERALDVAARSAGGQNDIMRLFYLQQLGMPVPVQAPLALGSRPQMALPGGGAPIAVQDGTWIVGREGQVILSGDGISRHHARVDAAGGRLSLTDLGSTNGTSICGRRLSPNISTPVSPGDVIRFGSNVSLTAEQLIGMLTGSSRGNGQPTTAWGPVR